MIIKDKLRTGLKSHYAGLFLKFPFLILQKEIIKFQIKFSTDK